MSPLEPKTATEDALDGCPIYVGQAIAIRQGEPGDPSREVVEDVRMRTLGCGVVTHRIRRCTKASPYWLPGNAGQSGALPAAGTAGGGAAGGSSGGGPEATAFFLALALSCLVIVAHLSANSMVGGTPSKALTISFFCILLADFHCWVVTPKGRRVLRRMFP